MQLFSNGSQSQLIDHMYLVLNFSKSCGFMSYPVSMNLKQWSVSVVASADYFDFKLVLFMYRLNRILHSWQELCTHRQISGYLVRPHN